MITWKGKFKGFDQMDKGELPLNAIKFKEPDSFAKLNAVVFMLAIPLMAGLVFAVKIKTNYNLSFSEITNFNGLILALLAIVPHEYLHAIAFPKSADVQIWYSPKSLTAFVYSTTPTTKFQYIYMSLLPNLVFSIIPLLLWFALPYEPTGFSHTWLSFAVLSTVMGLGDYMNIFNATFQMPKGSLTQLSGLNSYWYMPEDLVNHQDVLH